MKTASSACCLCEGSRFALVFLYEAPPEGETHFLFSNGGAYRREILRCEGCGHFVTIHEMDMSELYAGDYVRSTYGDGGIRHAFDRINALDPEKSDNVGRVRRISDFASGFLRLLPGTKPSILDVGSGLCVFLYRMKEAGWECTAVDPDSDAAAHARETVRVRAFCGDFLFVEDLGRFDAVTFNKVLEHVQDPVKMLAKARDSVKPEGFVYVELPDGEMAVKDGPNREEFFIDHFHIFSAASLIFLALRSGFKVQALERLQEPSGKYTLRAFLIPDLPDTENREKLK